MRRWWKLRETTTGRPVISLTRAESAGEEPEHPSEAVDALIEAGQDEGILEESDRDLIHSVVEFGDKTVRDVMTPRPSIFAVPAETTVEQLTHLLSEHPYSRIPVYRGELDNILGILSARDLLQVADSEASRTLAGSLMKTDVYFVPETRRATGSAWCTSILPWSHRLPEPRTWSSAAPTCGS